MTREEFLNTYPADKTKEEFLKSMLEKVPNDLDKREGSLIYDSLASASWEFELFNATIKWLMYNTFGDTAERPFLIERARERGLKPKPETVAVLKGEILPVELAVPIGSRFNCDEMNYKVIKSLGAGQYLLECETKGIIGNKDQGALVPISFIQGFKTGKVLQVAIPGVDEEETEIFRQRYLKSFDSQAYGGNIADYKEKIMNIPGVGGVKVYPVWNGGGTVKAVFITSEFKTPDSEFIKKVQEAIDPIPYHQNGVGIAPIGHYVTIEGVKERVINITTNLTLKPNIRLNQIEAKLNKVLSEYIHNLNHEWADTQTCNTEVFTDTGLTVRLAKIESILIDLEEVVDVENTAINGNKKNLTLKPNEITKFGGATYE